jgi:hypothetical protein
VCEEAEGTLIEFSLIGLETGVVKEMATSIAESVMRDFILDVIEILVAKTFIAML